MRSAADAARTADDNLHCELGVGLAEGSRAAGDEFADGCNVREDRSADGHAAPHATPQTRDCKDRVWSFGRKQGAPPVARAGNSLCGGWLQCVGASAHKSRRGARLGGADIALGREQAGDQLAPLLREQRRTPLQRRPHQN